MEMFGVLMPKEPSIMKMDWRSLGYEKEYKDGRLRWVPQKLREDSEDKDTST
jgi:hypothetical protein